MLSYNYSRLLGLERRYEEEIEVATIGQQACIQYNKTRGLGGLLLNIAYAQHGLGLDNESKSNLIDAYFAYRLMKDDGSCTIIQKYAKETFDMELNF